jgi:non-haem Fe2+, alpha-ketoglutarate-dependent halogenase
MNRPLTDEQRQRYREEGLVFPVRVLTREEADAYRRACDDLEAQLGGRPRTIEVRQMHLHFPWAYALATHPRILDAVEHLLGPDLLVWATELFAKHPHDAAVSIGWHRDRPYMGFDAGATVTAWVALTESTAANGCMRAAPGPERHAGPPPRRAGGPGAVAVDERAGVDVALHAGEMSLHDADILHGSGPNRSGGKRVGFVIRYVTPEARPLTGRPTVILARGRGSAGEFHVVGPPTETDGRQALAELKKSAALHLDAMLQNLKLAGR